MEKIFYFKDNLNDSAVQIACGVNENKQLYGHNAAMVRSYMSAKAIEESMEKPGVLIEGDRRWKQIDKKEYDKIHARMKQGFEPSIQYIHAVLKSMTAAKLKAICAEIEGLEYENAESARLELGTGAYNDIIMKNI